MENKVLSQEFYASCWFIYILGSNVGSGLHGRACSYHHIVFLPIQEAVKPTADRQVMAVLHTDTHKAFEYVNTVTYLQASHICEKTMHRVITGRSFYNIRRETQK